MSGHNETFYRDDTTQVSRYWLTHEATSYAIRTLIRLTYIERKPPPVRSLLLVMLLAVVLFIAIMHLLNESLPAPLAWTLIVASAALFLYSLTYMFLRPPLFLLKASFLDGKEVKIMRRSKVQAERMRDAINHAMNYHRYYASMFDEMAHEPSPEFNTYDAVAEAAAKKQKRKWRGMLALLYGSAD